MLRHKQINTIHGKIKTPIFLPDATYGTISSISFDELISCNINEIVTNTLHLEIFPGSDYIKKIGGLHKFYNFHNPILTDSGGFQVFSLIHRRKNKYNFINKNGAFFKNPKTGKKYKLTPESSQQIQHKLGSDIRTVLDEPIPHRASLCKMKKGLKRTTNWAIKSKNEFLKLNNINNNSFNKTFNTISRPLLGAVIQGGDRKNLRKQSIEDLIQIGFDMYNLGGFLIKDDGTLDLDLSKFVVDLLPKDKFRYAMGVGNPDDIINLAHMGWDIFDCVLPTRNARHGYLYVPKNEGDQNYDNYSVVHIKTKRYKYADDKISSKTHPLLANISRAYLRHLFKINDPLAYRLATLNNLWFYSKIIEKLQNEKI